MSTNRKRPSTCRAIRHSPRKQAFGPALALIPAMLWFCSGHFAATWLVCLTLIFRFHAAAERPLTFVLFALILWPVLLELLPLRGYFALKRVTLDRLKARVHRGELKKAVVFAFGFCTSLLAAAGIGMAAWGLGLLDGWFGKMDRLAALPTLAWLPITFVLWVVPPVIAVAMLAGKSNAGTPESSARKGEHVHA